MLESEWGGEREKKEKEEKGEEGREGGGHGWWKKQKKKERKRIRKRGFIRDQCGGCHYILNIEVGTNSALIYINV